MGHKWLKAFSKAVTYLGSGVTALTGTMQTAQQQEQIDAAWAALLHTPDAAVVSETSTPQAAPMDELRDYLERAGITAPVRDSRKRERPAAQTAAPQATLAQGEVGAAASGKSGGTPAGEKPWEIDPPAEILYNAVQDAGDGLTGGDIAEAQERAKELDEAVHGGPLYGEYADLTPLLPDREPLFLPKPSGGVSSPIPTKEKQLALPPSDDTLPKMLTGGGGNPFQGTYTLKPNQTYTANGATYHTDENGAIQSWSATLTGPQQTAPRSPSHQKNLPGKLEGDHAGHYLAASEGGSGLADNLAPMDAKVNTRDYRAFERENHRLLEEGDTVRLEGSSHMGSSKLRPDGIMVTRSVYDSDGNLVDREHFSWTNTDMSRYQDNDFGDPSIPNAMDESLDKAGLTREEIAALEEAEQEPAKSGKQMETADQSQTGAASDGQAERTDDKTEDGGRQSERNTSEKEQNQRERQEGEDPEQAEDVSGQEMDDGQKPRQPEQRSRKVEQAPSGENKTGDREESEQNTSDNGRESPEQKDAGKGETEQPSPDEEKKAEGERKPESEQNAPDNGRESPGKNTGEEQTDQTPSGKETEESGKKSTGQEAPEADQKQPDQSRQAEPPSQTAGGKTANPKEDQTSGQKADDGGQQEPWKRSGGREVEPPRQADQPQEPWRREGPDQDSGAEKNGGDRSKDRQHPDGVEKDGQEDGRQPQGAAPAQAERPKSAPEKEPLPPSKETPRDPWRKEDGAGKPRQEDPREESKGKEPQNKPQEPPKQESSKQEPPSHDDGPTNNKDGGYHY